MSLDQVLNDEERLAGLDLRQLEQLVGLVEHDEAADPFPVSGWDALVWTVGNAVQTAHFFQSALGMELVAYSGPETGNRDSHAYVLTSGAARFVVQGAYDPASPLADHHRAHGDGIVDIALTVPDVDRCIEHARRQGATIVEEPHDVSDEHGTVRRAAIAAYGDTVHSLVDRSGYRGPYLPGFVEKRSTFTKREGAPKRLFQAVDHVVGNVELGAMDAWVDFYNRVMGFTNMAEFIGEDIATDYSALMSKVVASGNHRVKFPLNEPAIARQEEVADRRVPGVLRRPRRPAPGPGHRRHRGRTVDTAASPPVCSSWTTPDSYYDRPRAAEPDRRGPGPDRGPCSSRGILVDRDEDGYLLQIFTKPTGDRPTVFFELIERHGSLGFGKGNFKALFEAIEREQERRGNF